MEVVAWTYYSKKRMLVCVVLSGDKKVRMCCKSKGVFLLGTCQCPARKEGDISLQFGRNSNATVQPDPLRSGRIWIGG